MSLEHNPSRQQATPASDDHGARSPPGGCFTVAEFCHFHRISRSALYEAWRAGTGPRYFYNGARRIIAGEAAADWRRQREQAAAA
jgi:hypothetical protein